jgi:hypothetical protein
MDSQGLVFVKPRSGGIVQIGAQQLLPAATLSDARENSACPVGNRKVQSRRISACRREMVSRNQAYG